VGGPVTGVRAAAAPGCADSLPVEASDPGPQPVIPAAIMTPRINAGHPRSGTKRLRPVLMRIVMQQRLPAFPSDVAFSKPSIPTINADG
jgi:hypothetical protein